MQRVVEFFVDGQWRAFDPSSLHRDIPLPSWRHVVMARTTLPDEDAAMKPRWGVARGCPYGQELEFLGNGLSFSVREFFWTEARALLEFEASDETVAGAGRAWEAFLKTGRTHPPPYPIEAAADAEKFLQALKESDGIDGR
jgi:hypothetical protein